MTMRSVFIFLHRYVGLAIALFLVVAGLTGSVLAFYRELDPVFYPEFHTKPAHAADATPLDIMTLREKLLDEVPNISNTYIVLDTEPGKPVGFFVGGVKDPDTGKRIEPVYWKYYVDAYTGKFIGGRHPGVLGFIHKLHTALAIGKVGKYLLGAVALLWTFDCFVGAFLTFPPRNKSKSTKGKQPANWLWRWMKSWVVKTGSFYKLTFTWHQATGLWLWALLLIFAWSAVSMNLRQVYNPVMSASLGMDENVKASLPNLETPRPTPGLGWRDAHKQAKALMAAEAQSRGFTIQGEHRFRYDAGKGLFQYQVLSSLDVNRRHANTTIFLDGETGELVAFASPVGKSIGAKVTIWLHALHFAAVGSVAYQVFVCLLGIFIVVLSISGIIIWWKKLRSRRTRKSQQAPPASN